MIVFEALNALYGDCLILRYEDAQGGKRIWVIDGGPRSAQVGGRPVSVWRDVLLPRLAEIEPAGPCTVDLGMVSHIDDDHINGIERLTADLVAGLPHPGDVKFRRFWFNAFDEIVGPAPAGSAQSNGAIALQLSNPTAGLLPEGALGHDGDAVTQSIPQGNKLAANLRSLSLQGNQPVNGLVAARPGQAALDIDGAKVTIVGPLQNRLNRLRDEWREALAATTETARAAALADLFATRLDSSVPNLSSIVVLVEIGGKRMLLTGDARGDDIVTAWQQLGLPQPPYRIDLLKMPHHGSSANSPEAFMRFFEATHYVFSADGHHDNPDPPVLEGLVSIHGQRPIILHFTNADIVWKKPYRLERGGAEVKTLPEMLAALRAAYPGPWTSQVRPADRHSVEIPL
jgi:hypothetical protein